MDGSSCSARRPSTIPARCPLADGFRMRETWRPAPSRRAAATGERAPGRPTEHARTQTPRVSLHVIAVAESDFYLKWAVSLLGTLPRSTRIDVTLACSPIRPSDSQREAALAGTPFAGRRLEVLSPAQAAAPRHAGAAGRRPHRLRGSERARVPRDARVGAPHRPVLLAGIPGIALPARRRAWGYRGAIDMLVVHSHREVAEYDAVRARMGKTGRIGLADDPLPRRPPRAAAGRRRRPARGG